MLANPLRIKQIDYDFLAIFFVVRLTIAATAPSTVLRMMKDV